MGLGRQIISSPKAHKTLETSLLLQSDAEILDVLSMGFNISLVVSVA